MLRTVDLGWIWRYGGGGINCGIGDRGGGSGEIDGGIWWFSIGINKVYGLKTVNLIWISVW